MEPAKLVIAIEGGEDAAAAGDMPIAPPRAEYPPIPPPPPFPDPRREPQKSNVYNPQPMPGNGGAFPAVSALTLDQIRRALIESPGAKKSGLTDTVAAIKDESFIRKMYEQFAAAAPVLTAAQAAKMFPHLAAAGQPTPAAPPTMMTGFGLGTKPASPWDEVQKQAKPDWWNPNNFTAQPAKGDAGLAAWNMPDGIRELQRIVQILTEVKNEGGFGVKAPDSNPWDAVQARAKPNWWEPQVNTPQPTTGKTGTDAWNMPADRPTGGKQPRGRFDWSGLTAPPAGALTAAEEEAYRTYGYVPGNPNYPPPPLPYAPGNPNYPPPPPLPNHGPQYAPAGSGFGLNVPQRPRARVVTDGDKSRDQWSAGNIVPHMASWLPGGLGQKVAGRWEAMSGAYKAASGEAAAAGAGRLGAAAAGVGEAAIAGGPVVALAAVAAAAELSAKAHRAVTHAIEGLGTSAAKLAGNDHMGMMTGAVDAAKGALEEIPIIGKVWAAKLDMYTAPARAFAAAAGAFIQRAHELESFSGSISSASATATNRAYMGDLKEANRLGGPMARLIDANSRSSDAMRDLLLPIKEAVVRFLAWIAEGIAKGLELTRELRDFIVTAFDKLLETLQAISPIGDDIIQSIRDGLKSSPEPMQPIVEWIGAADSLGRGPAAGNGGGGAKRAVAGPVFPGFDQFAG